MNIVKHTIENKTTTYFILFLLLAGGILGFNKMAKLEDPQFIIKQAVVLVYYPGATAEQVEERVTSVLEKKIQEMDALDYVKSDSRDGFTRILINLQQTTPGDQVQEQWDILRRKVHDATPSLPIGILPPIIKDQFGDVFGMFYGITATGDVTQRELHIVVDEIKLRLQQFKGVSRIQEFGLAKESIAVEISPDKMANLGVSMDAILATFKRQNKVVVPNSITASPFYFKVNVEGSFDGVEDIGNMVISTGLEHQQVHLKDIATVKRSYKEPYMTKMKVNGNTSVGLAVSTKGGYNVVTVGQEVNEIIHSIVLPEGVAIQKIYNEGEAASESSDDFIENLVLAVFAVILGLLAFVGFRNGFLISTSLIFSVMAAIIYMWGTGIALQRVSLAAIIIALGMLVDNAVVIGDYAMEKMQEGKDRMTALTMSVNKMAMPLLIGTVIAILTFLAIYLSPNTTGQYLSSLFIVLGVSLAFSWLLGVTQTPLALYESVKIKIKKTGTGEMPAFMKKFRQIIVWIVYHKWLFTISMIFVLFLTFLAFKTVKRDFVPPLAKSQFVASYFLPEGFSVYEVEDDLKGITEWLLEQEGVEQVVETIGQSAPRYFMASQSFGPQSNFGSLIVNMVDYPAVLKMMPLLDEYVRTNYPATMAFRASRYVTTSPVDAQVEAMFSGPDPLVVDSLVQIALDIMAKQPMLTNVRSSWGNRAPFWELKYSQSSGHRAFISREDIASTMAMANNGKQVTTLHEFDWKVPVLLQFKDSKWLDKGQMTNLPVWAAEQMVPMKQALKSSPMQMKYPLIQHYDRNRSMKAQADPAIGYNTAQGFASVQKEIEAIQLPEGYMFRWKGRYHNQKKAVNALLEFIPLSWLVIFLLIVILFNSVKIPVMIMLSLPFSFIGITAGLLIFDKEFGFMPLVGWLGLLGLLIRNEIVLLEEAVAQQKNGKNRTEAIVGATLERARPVVMAASTVVLGMIPLISDAVFGSMAASFIFGLVGSTILTLLITPSFYAIFYGIKRKEVIAYKKTLD